MKITGSEIVRFNRIVNACSHTDDSTRRFKICSFPEQPVKCRAFYQTILFHGALCIRRIVATVQFRIFAFPVSYLEIPVILYGCEAWFVGVREGRIFSVCFDIPVKSVRGA